MSIELVQLEFRFLTAYLDPADTGRFAGSGYYRIRPTWLFLSFEVYRRDGEFCIEWEAEDRLGERRASTTLDWPLDFLDTSESLAFAEPLELSLKLADFRETSMKLAMEFKDELHRHSEAGYTETGFVELQDWCAAHGEFSSEPDQGHEGLVG